jgi:group II intron reverse transcriptase/maturase
MNHEESAMLNAQRYLNLIHDRGQQRLPLERVYRNIRRQDLFLLAYGKLYANQGAMTKGADPQDTIDGMSLDRIDRIIHDLAHNTFRWKPVRRTYIPKANGRKRPLGVPGWTDKIVQEVIRCVLEAYYEPQFSSHAHGFRPDRGCHTALAEIVQKWKGTRWFIEGDIKGCFDNIDHAILLQLIAAKIHDNRLMKLLKEMLAAGYIEDWKHHRTYSGTPQGGILSPLLANIYLNELDQFVEQELLPKYNQGTTRRRNLAYGAILRKRAIAKATGNRESYRQLTKQMYRTPSQDAMDPNYRRLRYVRYADDFLLGFEGPKAEAEEIKQRLRSFLAERLKLELSEEKTLITNAREEPARFLGYNIHICWENSKITKHCNGTKSRVVNGLPMLRVPHEVKQQWRRKFSAKGKPERRPELLTRTDYDIVMWYQIQWSGLVHYYQMAVNVTSLQMVKWTMEVSLVKTLANKHKCSVRTVYRNYRHTAKEGNKGIRATLQREGKPPLETTFGMKAVHYQRVTTALKDNQFAPYGVTSQLSDRLQAEVCELCGHTEQIEVHHIKKLADLREQCRKDHKPAWMVKMLAIRRKTLVVCKDCHQRIHAGVYDGPKLT